METKYKGYEDLLDVDEHDPTIFIPSDVQGSVRALKYALAHPLVFSEPQGTYKERRIEKTKVRPFLRIFGFEKLRDGAIGIKGYSKQGPVSRLVAILFGWMDGWMAFILKR